ncbi:MAG: hypothetical protein M3444_08240, partial [Acidobacteriota bacterium]|nr:hypothetical protein [Acidobacteriota bacterium]
MLRHKHNLFFQALTFVLALGLFCSTLLAQQGASQKEGEQKPPQQFSGSIFGGAEAKKPKPDASQTAATSPSPKGEELSPSPSPSPYAFVALKTATREGASPVSASPQ